MNNEDRIIKCMSDIMLILSKNFEGEDILLTIEALARVLIIIVDDSTDYKSATSGTNIVSTTNDKLALNIVVKDTGANNE